MDVGAKSGWFRSCELCLAVPASLVRDIIETAVSSPHHVNIFTETPRDAVCTPVFSESFVFTETPNTTSALRHSDEKNEGPRLIVHELKGSTHRTVDLSSRTKPEYDVR